MQVLEILIHTDFNAYPAYPASELKLITRANRPHDIHTVYIKHILLLDLP